MRYFKYTVILYLWNFFFNLNCKALTCDDINCERIWGQWSACSKLCGKTNRTEIYKNHQLSLNCPKIEKCAKEESEYCNCRSDCENGFFGCCCDIDIDECKAIPSPCSQRCVNTRGSYRCECYDGFILDDSGRKCIDHDECNTNNGGCKDVCQNSLGSYSCSCRSGYNIGNDGISCIVNDFCSSNKRKCSQICINTQTSSKCSCYPGYKLDNDGITCSDIDECEENEHNCSQLCYNTQGSFICSCKVGYRLKFNTKCLDINECAENDHSCSHICNNSPGSFSCSCPFGYRLDGDKVNCEDVNECRTNVCDHVCENTEGSYNCHCKDGYKFNKTSQLCEDIDECSTEGQKCEHSCENTPGHFNCLCSFGFEIDHNKYDCKLNLTIKIIIGACGFVVLSVTLILIACCIYCKTRRDTSYKKTRKRIKNVLKKTSDYKEDIKRQKYMGSHIPATFRETNQSTNLQVINIEGTNNSSSSDYVNECFSEF
ncbi:DgyrCDS2174 [Dimorphilus gyrociliatus]|uniref:DgyrCDS2174 n=1 Tax=Dimorphilus gyrociliatus TaxID=2664684 RepID=A0A7I8V9Q0_9ANNE|nr:DgyrCDS2174 [Dimorphilus gyrociliatus]